MVNNNLDEIFDNQKDFIVGKSDYCVDNKGEIKSCYCGENHISETMQNTEKSYEKVLTVENG